MYGVSIGGMDGEAEWQDWIDNKELGPVAFQDNDVYLRTAVGVAHTVSPVSESSSYAGMMSSATAAKPVMNMTRIAGSIAKGVAFANGVPLFAVSSLGADSTKRASSALRSSISRTCAVRSARRSTAR